MSNWSLEYTYLGNDVSLDAYYRNVTSLPVISITRTAELTEHAYCPIPGIYRFFMESNTTVSVTAVYAGDYKSPMVYLGARVVVADGATKNYNLIPGLGIVLANNTVWGDQFDIGVGCYWDSNLNDWIRVLPQDLCFPNVDKSEFTIKAWNATGQVQCNSYAIVTNSIRCINEIYTNRPFKCFRQTGTLNPVAHEDLNGRLVTFDNRIEYDGIVYACILVDGVRYDVIDETNQDLKVNGMYLACDGSTVFRFADNTPYRTGEFILSPDVIITDRAALFVSDAGEFSQIAAVGTDFVDGPTGIWLTESGCPEGIVESGSYAEFRVKLFCPAGKTNALNPRIASIRIGSEGIG